MLEGKIIMLPWRENNYDSWRDKCNLEEKKQLKYSKK